MSQLTKQCDVSQTTELSVDWDAAWRELADEQPPPGFKTVAQIGSEMGKAKDAARRAVARLVGEGRLEMRFFKGGGSGGNTVRYYRPICSKSVNEKQAKQKGQKSRVR